MLPTEKNKNYPVLLMLSIYLLLEITLLNVLFFAAHYYWVGEFKLQTEYRQLSFVSNIVWVALLFFFGDIRDFFKRTKEQTFRTSLRFVGFYISVFALYVLFLTEQPSSKSILAVYLFSLVLVIPAFRLLAYVFILDKNVHGSLKKKAVFIGWDSNSASLFKILNQNNYYGIECLGYFDDKDNSSSLLGTISSFYNFNSALYDYIYVSRNVTKDELVKIISYADQKFKKVKLLPEIDDDSVSIDDVDQIEDIAVLEVNILPLDKFFNALFKRVFDIAFTLVILILVLSWLYPLVSILILIDSRGPILFKQVRNGNKNSQFVCLKFRTMVINEESDTKWATKGDPRITRLGAFLRKTSIDELPQFINVLKGEMSVVGPRPLPIKLNEEYMDRIEKFLQRHSYKPGITGLAQSMGYRGEIETIQQINARVRLDRFYLQKWSFFFDLRIILKTIWVLLKGQDRAY
jgi:putative colanic acid biosynthesis UDP-glucose lipid carrier transferase